jgi:hypothetical protein
VEKRKRADIYLEVRKRRGCIFFERNKCLCPNFQFSAVNTITLTNQ